MICPMCIANAALALAGATTLGGAAVMTLRILWRKRGLKGKAEGVFLSFLRRRLRDRQKRAARSERHR